jgi:predicted aspartyl protease
VPPGQSQARSVSVSLSQSDGFEIVRVSINGKGPYDFILDTGSSVTLVRRELLDQIPITHREALPVNLATGTSYVEKAMVHTVAVAGLSAGNIEVVTLGAASEGLLKTNVRGILGENFLKHFDILLDNEKHTLTLDRTAGLADQLAGEHLRLSDEGSFGSVATPDRIIVNVTVPSSARNPQRFLVDTGTNMAMLFPAKEAAWVYPQTSSQFVMHSYTGSLQCRQERASLRIGNGTIDGIVFASCKGLTRDKMDTDGLLPAGLFGRIFISHHREYVIDNPQPAVTFGSHGGAW